MNNTEKLISVFSESLGIDKSKVTADLEYSTIAEWDSVAHMALVAEIDDQFDIMLDTDDVIELSSFSRAVEILKKYDIPFE